MLYLGADHAGYNLKEYIKKYLNRNKIGFVDLGNSKLQKNDDFPDYAKKVARKVSAEPNHRGILFCGSGQGMTMTANKFVNVRATLGFDTRAAQTSRLDNDSNILCLPARRISRAEAEKAVKVWLSTSFSGLVRHQRRIKKIKS